MFFCTFCFCFDVCLAELPKKSQHVDSQASGQSEWGRPHARAAMGRSAPPWVALVVVLLPARCACDLPVHCEVYRTMVQRKTSSCLCLRRQRVLSRDRDRVHTGRSSTSMGRGSSPTPRPAPRQPLHHSCPCCRGPGRRSGRIQAAMGGRCWAGKP